MRSKQQRNALIYLLLEQVSVTPAGCFIWTGRTCGKYGTLRFNGDQLATHRLSFELFRRPIPARMFVCHDCDVKLCINPSHLFLGTNRDNIRDAVAKNRMSNGELNGAALLTEPDVRAAIERYNRGDRVRDIASDLGVTSGAIYSITCGVNWQHLDLPPVIKRSCGRAGEASHSAKLTQPQVDEIREARSAGAKLSQLASKYAVTETTISMICNNRIWIPKGVTA